MGKSLVIVESPAKAKTINKYLGKDFVVKSSIGHIRDLPTSGSASKSDPKERARQAALTRKMSPDEKEAYKKQKAHEQLIGRMGVDPEHDWKASYEVLPGKEKVVDELKRLAENADQIYLATDLDREGEAIAWHLREVIGSESKPYRRVVFNEITKKAIQAAFEQPSELNINRVNAQQARRFLDRVVGFMVSPLLWAKVARGLSAGRVQSVAVRLIVEREREIRAFIPEEYWEAFANLKSDSGDDLRAQVVKAAGKEFRPNNEADTTSALDIIRKGPFKVTKREDKPTSSRPAAPFITSTLQQAASTRLGYSVKKTMTLAQRLYEAGYITYMRTDGIDMAPEAVHAARDAIKDRYGAEYVPSSPRMYKNKAKNAQEAHECIRPTEMTLAPDELKVSDPDQRKLYDLIWKRTLASQMEAARMERTTVDVSSADGQVELRATGQVVLFDGFLKIYEEGRDDATTDDDDKRLPQITQGEKADKKTITPEQHFTQPPPRYTEATLVKKMEELGIGRPSTYASIVTTIQDRGYVRKDKNRLIPEDKGRLVTIFLINYFRKYVGYDFTAELEGELDDITSGDREWKDVLDKFWRDFKAHIDETAELRISEVLDKIDEVLAPHLYPPTEDGSDPRVCPNCGNGRLSMRTARSGGAFIGCSNYPDCRYTRPFGPPDAEAEASAIPPEGKLLGEDEGDEIRVFKGRFGPYVQRGPATKEQPKPPRQSVPKQWPPEELTLEQAVRLLVLPRLIGQHPEDGVNVWSNIGRYGPYIKHAESTSDRGGTNANLDEIEEVWTVGMNRAVQLLAEKVASRGGRGRAAAPVRELGEHPEAGGPVAIYKGKYGPYVKWDKINATIPDTIEPEQLSMEQAVELIAERAAKAGKKAPAKKKAAAKKTTTKKTATKKTAAKKPAAKTKAAEADED